MRVVRYLAGWLVAALILALRWTCRVRLHYDPRPELRRQGRPYVYAVLHAHQIAAFVQSESNAAAMVSQSTDGEILIPTFQMMGVKPVRGSNRRHGRDRGGRAALEQLVAHVRPGAPAVIAVDGPRGPRNRVHKGIATLAARSDAAVLAAIAIPRRRWIIPQAWDRMQIPLPFTRVDTYFAPPLERQPEESVEQFRSRIETALQQLETQHDPPEAAYQGNDPRRVKPLAAA